MVRQIFKRELSLAIDWGKIKVEGFYITERRTVVRRKREVQIFVISIVVVSSLFATCGTILLNVD